MAAGILAVAALAATKASKFVIRHLVYYTVGNGCTVTCILGQRYCIANSGSHEAKCAVNGKVFYSFNNRVCTNLLFTDGIE